MTPFRWVMSGFAALVVIAVLIGGMLWGYTKLPDSTQSAVAAELAATKTELAKLKGTPNVSADPQVAELARLQRELADLKAGKPTAPAATTAKPQTDYAGKTSVAQRVANMNADGLEITSDPCTQSTGATGLVAKVKATGEMRCVRKN